MLDEVSTFDVVSLRSGVNLGLWRDFYVIRRWYSEFEMCVGRDITIGNIPSRSTEANLRCSWEIAAGTALRRHRWHGYTGSGIAVLTDQSASRTGEACCMTAHAA